MPAPICKQMKISDKIITATKSSCYDIDLTMKLTIFDHFFAMSSILDAENVKLGVANNPKLAQYFVTICAIE